MVPTEPRKIEMEIQNLLSILIKMKSVNPKRKRKKKRMIRPLTSINVLSTTDENENHQHYLNQTDKKCKKQK